MKNVKENMPNAASDKVDSENSEASSTKAFRAIISLDKTTNMPLDQIRMHQMKTTVDIDLGELACENMLERGLSDSSESYSKDHQNSVVSIAASPVQENEGRSFPGERRLELPMEVFKSAHLITPDLPKTELAEQFRAIKRPLLGNIDRAAIESSDKANVVMVTSCVEAEGKTFSAINLAISLSMEQDISVTLVDADVSKASCSTLLGVPEDANGLIDLLLDNTLLIEDVLWETDVTNMDILSCGQFHEHATELLAGKSLQLLLNKLAARYENSVVILDAPPILLTNDALVIAQKAGQIVFVVAAEETTHNMLDNALERISGKATISLILNKAKKSAWKRYGYGYGYGYGR